MVEKKKKKKREKNLGLSLSRIGSSLVPNAVFAAVPRTAQRLSETWPRKSKTISHLSTALGSVGNLAQAVVVGSSPSPREEFDTTTNTSNARFEEIEDYESEGHYAEVDEKILENLSSREEGDVQQGEEIPGENKEEVIYATVNKRRKPQVAEEVIKESSSGSEDDITSVSGMYSNDEDQDDLSSLPPSPSSKAGPLKQDSGKRKSSKEKSKRHSPRHASQKMVVEEHVTKIDVNDNLITNADFPDGLLPDDNDYQHRKMKNDFNIDNTDLALIRTTEHQLHRDYHQPSEFERQQFNQTNLDEYSEESPPPSSSRRRTVEPLGSSAPDLVNHPQIPPISERETPIGKGLSNESIASLKEQWHHLEQLTTRQEALYKHQLQQQKSHEEQQRKLFEHQAAVEKRLYELSAIRSSTGSVLPVGHDDTSEIYKRNEQINVSGRSTTGGTDHLYHQKGSPDSSSRLLSLQIQHENIQDTIPPKLAGESGRSRKEHQPKLNEEHQTKPAEGNNKHRRQLVNVVNQVKNKHSMNTDHEQDHFTEVMPSEEKTRHRKSDIATKKKRRKKTQDVEDQPSVSTTQPQDSPTRETLQQMSTTLAKETCRKLRQQVKVLDQEKSALASLSQSLNDENKTLKKLTQSLTKNQETESGVPTLLQVQNEELKDENTFLKDSVHRLNMELSRYQANFRPLLPQEMDTIFKSADKKQPSWLVDKKYMAPLLLAYDDHIKENQDIIKAYEKELQRFKEHVGEIVQENLELRQSLTNSQVSSHQRDECVQLEEHAKLVLQENVVLMERQEMQNNKMEELKTTYQEEVLRLSKLYTSSESEKSALESKLKMMDTTLTELKQELESSSSEWKKRISVEEHLKTVDECRSKLEELKKKTEEEIESVNSKLEAAQRENKNLTTQLADYKLANVQLEREVHSFTEIQRKNERKTLLLKEKLDHIQEREATAQDTLSEVLKVAEKTSAERDALNKMLTDQQLEQKKVQSLVKLEEDKLKECKNKAYNKIVAIKGRVKEQEKATEKLRDRYENEIKSLKVLIRRQQMQLEDMVNDKRNLENELNLIYEKVGVDSRTVNNVT